MAGACSSTRASPMEKGDGSAAGDAPARSPRSPRSPPDADLDVRRLAPRSSSSSAAGGDDRSRGGGSA
eukprot:2222604-Prymnesium_polylepis.1